MKTRVRRAVLGFIFITMGTSLVVVYNNSFDVTSGFHSSPTATGPPGKPRKAHPKLRPFTLQGYTGVINHKPLQMHCNCCALVTSSGHLIGSNRGEEIDGTECVIRMNDAPAGSSFQKDVGRRTSLRVIAHSSLQRVLRSRQELLNTSQDSVFLFWGPSSCMRRDGKGLVFNSLRLVARLSPRLKVYIIPRRKMLQFDELFEKETGKDRKSSNSWLSTGWFTMAVALELCDRVNVYGMVAPDFCRAHSQLSVPYHYYEPSGPDECSMYLSHEHSRLGSHHRFITEKTVFANWARTFDIHFYQPDWSPSANENRTPILAPAGSWNQTDRQNDRQGERQTGPNDLGRT